MDEQKTDLKLESIINIDKLDKNSLILFRVSEINDGVYQAVNEISKLYEKEFKQKNIFFLILKPGTKIETVNEKYMESIGYYKKDKSVIIH